MSLVTEPVIDKVGQDKDVDFEDVEEEERQRLDAAFDEVEDLEAMGSDNDSDPLSDDGNITDPDSDAEVSIFFSKINEAIILITLFLSDGGIQISSLTLYFFPNGLILHLW